MITPEALAAHPTLAMLDEEAALTQLEVDALRAPWLRGWSLGAGYRYSRVGPSTGQGFMLTLSLPLAPWRTALPLQESLRAEHAALMSQRALEAARLEHGWRAALARVVASREALEAMPEARLDAELTELARVAFDAGEIPLIELLDVFESEADLALARLDLQWEHRLSMIQLHHYQGSIDSEEMSDD